MADKTIADTDARAAEIVKSAESRATSIVAAAEAEAERLIDAAGGAAAEVFEKGEARLLAAVTAFMEGSTILQAALARVHDDAAAWRTSSRGARIGVSTTPASEPAASTVDATPPPPKAEPPQPSSPAPGAAHNGSHAESPDPTTRIRHPIAEAARFPPPPPPPPPPPVMSPLEDRSRQMPDRPQ